MKRLKTILLFAFVFITPFSFATTWDEPWQDQVIKQADYFVFAKVILSNQDTISIDIIKNLGVEELTGKINITNFYLLDLMSSSSGHGIEFEFPNVQESYFFIKKNNKGEYCIATPTTGFDFVKDNEVYATYRHSYHQALVPIEIYEKTMVAIFNNYHNKPYDSQFINDYVNKYVSLKPAGFNKSEVSAFFSQHVALECIYHLRLKDLYLKILPFLADTSNFHNQVSAARALISYNTTDCKEELMKVISDTSRGIFVKVICIWTLTDFKPTELKDRLEKIEKAASIEDNGFGGNLMDPRVGTHIPTVKDALNDLIKTL